ncbi:hypothetical protein ACHQM5_019543 [Ranunculus cassubicifolius]
MANEGFRLASAAITKEGRLPIKYNNEGHVAHKEISPPLEWYNVPPGTKSLALVVEDLEVPWVHWLVINIPPTLKGLPLGFSGKEDFVGVKEGIKWSGLEMVSHGHRFQFKIIALDADDMHLGNEVTKEKLLEEIQGHVLGEAVLTTVSELSPQDDDNDSPFTQLCQIGL